MIKWFQRLWIAISTVVLIYSSGIAWGGDLEAYFDPVVVNIRIVPGSVTRTETNLCYSWTGDTRRPADLIEIDGILERPFNHDISFPEIKEAKSGLGLDTRGLAQTRSNSRRDRCIDLDPMSDVNPNGIIPTEPLVLRVTALYKSAFGWWSVPSRLPPITSPGTP